MLRIDINRLTWIIIGFFGLSFLIYATSIWNNFVALDDTILVTENLAVQTFSLRSIRFIFTHFDPELYVPLTFLSYQIDHVIAGLNPTMFHFTNLVLHTLNALLVVWVSMTLQKKEWIALFVGLLFLVHPLNTEAVAWVSSRKDLLSTMFFLLSMGLYLRGQRNWSIGMFALGLLSKVSILMLPFVLLLTDWYQDKRLNWRDKLPYFGLSTFFGVIALFGKKDVLSETTFFDILIMAPKSTIFYIQNLLFPANLSVIYPYTDQITLISPDFFLPLLVFLGLLCLLLFSLKKHYHAITFSLLFFLLTLLPTFTNITKAGDVYFASDRYAYLPSIGFFLLLGIVLDRVIKGNQKVFAVVGSVILIPLSIAAHAQARVWRNTETLFINVLQQYPNSHLAYNKVGGVLLDRGELEEAKELIWKSLELKPTSRAYFNLGIVMLENGEVDASRDANEAALALDGDYVPALVNLGFLKYSDGAFEESIAHYEKAIALSPFIIDARIYLAAVLIELGESALPEKLLTEVLNLDPYNQQAVVLLQSLRRE